MWPFLIWSAVFHIIICVFSYNHFWNRLRRPCRNETSHSNGRAYQTKTFLDNRTNGSERWLNDYNKEYYRNKNTKQNQCDVNNHRKQSLTGGGGDDDHRIRITVNCENEPNEISSNENRISNEESESGASITIVEIDNSEQSDDDINTSNIIIKNNTLTDNTRRYKNSFVSKYNEKPIDVPEDFERKAYEFQRNKLSPFVRNLQPNLQVILMFVVVFIFFF